jgi:hypothetical protein
MLTWRGLDVRDSMLSCFPYRSASRYQAGSTSFDKGVSNILDKGLDASCRQAVTCLQTERLAVPVTIMQQLNTIGNISEISRPNSQHAARYGITGAGCG